MSGHRMGSRGTLPGMSPTWTRIPVWAYVSAAILLIGVPVGLGWGWVQTANRAAAQVQVSWRPGASHCTEHSLRRAPHRGGVHGPAVFVHPGTRCTLNVQVVNGSSHSVRVDSVVGELLGEQSSHILTALGATNGDKPRGERMDAFWTVDQTIAPGQVLRHRVQVGYRSSACGSGDAMGLRGFPAVRITVLGRGYTMASHVPLWWVERGAPQACGN
jgi:hypothetical protein